MPKDLLMRATQPEYSGVSAPKAMLVFAHPDDETIALGARLKRVGASAHILHVTDGAPRDERDSRALGLRSYKEYQRIREKELLKAFEIAEIKRFQWTSLGIPDQQVCFNLPWITQEVLGLVSRHQPEVIFTHPYEGGHPDHDACAFAVHHAGAEMKACGEQAPAIIEAAFYHAGAEGIETGCFLPYAQTGGEICYILSPEERHSKRRLLSCFASQQKTLNYFSVERERFRIAPCYDFRSPPHAGKVFYDNYDWGITSQHFCELAAAAEDAMRSVVATCH
ncbi:MAG TPA: PIG-L family deacetylase [Edaphobacter sp.]|nr:PIG-L family deacetylase [Edaphobacter sp.]